MAEADLVAAGQLRRSERAEEVDIARQWAFWTKVSGIAALVAVVGSIATLVVSLLFCQRRYISRTRSAHIRGTGGLPVGWGPIS
ncbi:hypothetical protein [Rhodococcus opacus]|uniref:hypothetical protein n=1 Tax=Rhodococcus opacus TaxID=37919 RepID=UPI00139221EB|nr:hypothetical protein [Rhodococcus opacus]